MVIKANSHESSNEQFKYVFALFGKENSINFKTASDEISATISHAKHFLNIIHLNSVSKLFSHF